MILEHKISGAGSPVLVLHGLFGAKENLGVVSRHLAEQFTVVGVDLRNHGRSFHTDTMDYPTMAQDVVSLMDHLDIDKAALLGHSMGGKVAMQVALQNPERVSRLVVADIAPVAYSPHHQEIIKGFLALDATSIENRKQADDIMAEFEPDLATRQFLLTNLQRGAGNQLGLRLNIDGIVRSQNALCAAIDGSPFRGPALFIRGANSDYVVDDSKADIGRLFPNYRLETIASAGHNLHVEQPLAFNEAVSEFLTRGTESQP
ncbi:MAG: alpha/beta fold hydrolase [bacterium]